MKEQTKHPKQFRLSHEALMALEWLAKEEATSQTAVLERAVLAMAKKAGAQRKKPKAKNWLLEFAGILTDEEADGLMRSSKKMRRDFSLPRPRK